MASPLRRAVVTIGALGLAGLTAVGGPAVFAKLVARPHTFTVSSVPRTPVALVLGAQIYPDGTPSPYLKGRLDTAKRLYDTGKVRAILVSGDNGDSHYNEPDGMRNYLVRKGVPATRVIADYAGFDTYDSCVRAKRIFGVDRLTIVTQGYHLPRAITTCRLVGVNAEGVGDYTTNFGPVWRYGQVRELGANMKMVVDVITRRTPTLGRYESSVDEALARG
ncbi:SanA/YdcF family protein [Granulicoccus sp. GXG6511]|uniref:SanA/YdcF family protein n=1 Tax=Granulicoccus sp. GXG6511 TaxID=3381351 RepID=UPI003D7DC9C6